MDFSGRNILATLRNIAISYDRLDNMKYSFSSYSTRCRGTKWFRKINRFDGNNIITSVCLPFQMKVWHQGKKDYILCLILVDCANAFEGEDVKRLQITNQTNSTKKYKRWQTLIMIIKFVIKFLPTCLPSGLTVAAPDAFGRIPGVVYITCFVWLAPRMNVLFWGPGDFPVSYSNRDTSRNA